MWNFFNTDSHKKAIGKTPGYRFSGGRGESVSHAIQIHPKDIQHLREVFLERIKNEPSGKYNSLREPQMLDFTLGEWAKEKYLFERFGRKGSDWNFGTKTQISPGVESVEIRLKNGDRTTLYFDLSAFLAKQATHEETIRRLSGINFSGGNGSSAKDAIRISPNNIEEMQAVCRKTLDGKMSDAILESPEVLNPLIGEMIKMQYLEQRFGKQDKDWFCGERAYLEGTIQSQIIRLSDGRELKLFFDFSEMHGVFTEKEASENRPTIYVDSNAIPAELNLIGRNKSVVMHSEMFGILLMTAYSAGWRGGAHLMKATAGKVSLRDFEKASLDDTEARTLGEALSRTMKVDPETLEGGDLQPVIDLLDLCKTGGFTISVPPNN